MAGSGKGFGADVDWQGMAEQYWKNFGELTEQAMAAMKMEPAAVPQWADGLEQWRRLFEGSMNSSDVQSGLDQLLDHGRGYLRFMQELAQNGGQFDPTDLRAAAERMVAEFRSANPLLQAFPGQDESGDLLRQLMGWWQQATAPGKEEARSWLRMPAFGMAREYQEQAQAYAAAQLDYREAMAGYNALIAQAVESGISGFQAKLDERGEQGRGIENLRGLYDLFVDALEEAYAEVALTEEFGRAYGKLVDSQSRLRLAGNQVVEQISRALGMPTRTEVDTLEQRVHQLRREAKNRSEHPALNELKSEVDQLRAELAALKASRGVGEHDDDDPPKPKTSKPRSSSARAGRKPVVATKPAAKAAATATSKKAAPKRATRSKSKPATRAAKPTKEG